MVIKMRKIWEKNSKLILIVTIAIVLASGATYAATTMYDSNIVGYDNTTSGLRSTNVQSALDELYGNVAEVILNIKTTVEALKSLTMDNEGIHNSIFRGEDVSKYMPSSVVSGGDGSIYNRISGNGYSLFEDLYVGDYIVANNITWRIAGFDIYYGKGDTAFNTHHAVIVPDTNLTSAVMNDSSTTSGGYVGSKMYTTTLPSVLTTYINPVFSGHVLSHRTLLTNSVGTSVASSGYAGWTGAANSWAWYDRQVDLMNEVQVTGTTAVSSSFFDVGADNIQFPLFRLRPEFVNKQRSWYWLRAVSSSPRFVAIGVDGPSYGADASGSGGVRPYFYIG